MKRSVTRNIQTLLLSFEQLLDVIKTHNETLTKVLLSVQENKEDIERLEERCPKKKKQ